MDRVDCPVFRPTMLEMSRSMEKFIEGIEAECRRYGICKIAPPSPWKACDYVGQDRQTYIGRIDQEFTRDTMVSGFYSGTLAPLRKQKVRDYQQEAEKSGCVRRRDGHQDVLAGLEKAYWKGIPGHVIYGADNEGSLFDKDIKEWNPANLDSCLSRGLASDPSRHRLQGVNTPYLYYGRWKATFAWHTEDMDLHSLNYLHYGAPKVWWCVSPAHKAKMDAFVAGRLYAQHDQCKQLMRHKTVLIKPEELEAHGIPVQRVVQHPGDFIINFPGAYHSGFNVGFNCAESTNFATTSWIQHGAVADFCRCRGGQDSVRLDMALFLAQAPDGHARRLVRQRIMTDKAARGERVDASDSLQATVVESAHDTNNLQHDEVKGKPIVKASAQATGKRRRKASACTQVNSKAAGALHKLAKGVRQVKQALQPRKAKQGNAGTAGKTDIKQTAAMLKRAKHAEMSPSAAAKLPQAKQVFPLRAPCHTASNSGSPAKARGRPKGSTKAQTDLSDRHMQVQTHILKAPQQTSQLSQLPTSQQQQKQQQQSTVPSQHQLPVLPGSPEAQQLGKRKRSTHAGADEGTFGDGLHAKYQKTMKVVQRWMTGGRPDKHSAKHRQAALPQLPNAQLSQQAQQARGVEQNLQADQAGSSGLQPCGGMQPTHQAEQAHEVPLPNCEQLQQSSGQGSNQRRRVDQAATETAFTGRLRYRLARPTSAILKWHGCRSRSCRPSKRAGTTTSIQELLSR